MTSGTRTYRNSSERERRQGPAIVFLALLALIALLQAWTIVGSTQGLDFYQFWAVPRIVSEARPVDVYSPENGRRWGAEFLRRADSEQDSERLRSVARQRSELDNQSTPFLYTVFRLFSTGRYERDYDRYQLAATLLGVAGLVACARALHYSPTETLGAVAVFALWFQPMQSEIGVANVNRLQLAALGLLIWMRSRPPARWRDPACGVLLGLLVAFKPNLALVPFLFCLFALINRRTRKLSTTLLGIAGGLIVAVLASSLFFASPRAWAQWSGALPELLEQGSRPRAAGNFGLVRLILDWTGLDLSIVLLLLSTATVLTLAWVSRRSAVAEAPSRELTEDLLAVGLGAAIAVLSAGLTWAHYYVLLIPLALHVLHPPGPRGPLRLLLAGVALALFCIRPMPRIVDMSETLHFTIQCTIGALVWFGLGLLQLRDLGREAVSSSS